MHSYNVVVSDEASTKYEAWKNSLGLSNHQAIEKLMIDHCPSVKK